MEKKILKGEKKSDVTLGNLKKVAEVNPAPAPSQKKVKDVHPFTLNIGESSYNDLINIYQTYKLENDFFSLTLTQFYEVVVIFYEEYLRKNNLYTTVPEYYVKDVLKKTGRRKLRPVMKDEPIINSNIWFDTAVYNTYLDITYSYVINFDKVNADIYSLSYIAYKLIDFLEANQKEFNKFKLEKFIK